MTSAELNPELRSLIDERLDALDRVLIAARIAWSERRSIVGEVETQIFELLARRGETPTRDDVAAVLDSLDPPDAYLPEECRGRVTDAAGAADVPRPKWRQWPLRAVRLVARFIPAALCAVALVTVDGIVVLLVAASKGVIPWTVTLAVLAWLNYAGVRWLRARSASRQGGLFDELRRSLAAWLMPNNGAVAT